MKINSMIVALGLSLCAFVAQAQTTTQSISDEDLKKYAMTMDSVKGMQETLQQIIAETVQKNTVVSVARYNELFKIADSPEKLKAANATPEEVNFLKEVNELRQYNISRINTTYQALAKDYVGLKAFNAIKKSLQSDEKLKARYEAISQGTSGAGDTASSKGGK